MWEGVQPELQPHHPQPQAQGRPPPPLPPLPRQLPAQSGAAAAPGAPLHLPLTRSPAFSCKQCLRDRKPLTVLYLWSQIFHPKAMVVYILDFFWVTEERTMLVLPCSHYPAQWWEIISNKAWLIYSFTCKKCSCATVLCFCFLFIYKDVGDFFYLAARQELTKWWLSATEAEGSKNGSVKVSHWLLQEFPCFLWVRH